MTSYDEVMAAVAEGDMKRVCFLVQGEPGILVRPEGGGSLLLTALYRGRQDPVDVLTPRVQMDVFEAAARWEIWLGCGIWKKNPQLLRQHSSDGWTALHLAAFAGASSKRSKAAVGVGSGCECCRRTRWPISHCTLHWPARPIEVWWRH
jgi:hypothetical protein